MDQSVEASTVPSNVNPGQSPQTALGQIAPGQVTPGQIPQGQLPQGQMPQGQITPGQAPQGQMAVGGGLQIQGQIPQGLPVWCMGELPVPDIYMMVLQASLR